MKVLLFFPGNSLNVTAGNEARSKELLNYFKTRGIPVDFCCFEHNIDKQSEEQLKGVGYINELFKLSSNKSSGFLYLFQNSIPNALRGTPKRFNKLSPKIKNEFKRIIKNSNYDYIIISYAIYVCLLDTLKETLESKIIVDTHDLMTAQLKNDRNFNVGKYLNYELKQLNKADIIWAISPEEKYLFSCFLDKQIDIIPYSILEKEVEKTQKEIDILFVGSENSHNVLGIHWFLDKVYPLIKENNYSMTIVGKVNRKILEIHKSIRQIEFLKDLDTVYKKSRVTICPVFSGTGLKIKVIESLSYGVPVVTTEKGMDGLLNKSNNGCCKVLGANDFAAELNMLLNDHEYYKKKQKQAFEFFQGNYTAEHVFKRIDKSLEQKFE